MRISHVIKSDQWRTDPQIRPAPHFVVSRAAQLYRQWFGWLAITAVRLCRFVYEISQKKNIYIYEPENGSSHSQGPAAPGRGSAAGWTILAPPYYSQRVVFASLWALFSFSIRPYWITSWLHGRLIATKMETAHRGVSIETIVLYRSFIFTQNVCRTVCEAAYCATASAGRVSVAHVRQTVRWCCDNWHLSVIVRILTYRALF